MAHRAIHRLGLVISLAAALGCRSRSQSPQIAAAPAPAMLNIKGFIAADNEVAIAELALQRPLTVAEQEGISGGHAVSLLLVGAIRQMEGGSGANGLVLRHHADCKRGPCPALKAWAGALIAGQPVEPTALFSQFGSGALFADVMIHDGSGSPTLRALYVASGGSLSAFDATEAAQLGRLMPEVRSQGPISAQVAWILTTAMTTRMRVLCLFDLGPSAVGEVNALYQADTGAGAFSVSHEELALVFAMVAFGRGQDVTMRSSDAALPAVQAYVNGRRSMEMSFDMSLSRASVFIASEHELHLTTLSPSERRAFERPVGD